MAGSRPRRVADGGSLNRPVCRGTPVWLRLHTSRGHEADRGNGATEQARQHCTPLNHYNDRVSVESKIRNPAVENNTSGSPPRSSKGRAVTCRFWSAVAEMPLDDRLAHGKSTLRGQDRGRHRPRAGVNGMSSRLPSSRSEGHRADMPPAYSRKKDCLGRFLPQCSVFCGWTSGNAVCRLTAGQGGPR